MAANILSLHEKSLGFPGDHSLALPAASPTYIHFLRSTYYSRNKNHHNQRESKLIFWLLIAASITHCTGYYKVVLKWPNSLFTISICMHIEKERQTFTLKVRINYHNHFDHKPKLIFQNFESCSLQYMYLDLVLGLTFILPFAFFTKKSHMFVLGFLKWLLPVHTKHCKQNM